MGLKIHTNVGSVHSQRPAIEGSEPLRSSLRRLSTGLRISTPAGDARVPSFAEQLRSRVRSVEQARREANDEVALLQTVEGTLVEVFDLLARLRTLTVQSTLDRSSPSLAIQQVDTAVEGVRSLHGNLDAVHQRLASTLDNLSKESEALLASNHGIRDVDRALETATQTRHSIMEQASMALRGQANALPDAALVLLEFHGTRKPTPRARDFRT